MISEQLINAIRLAKAGEKDTARQMLLKIVQEEPYNELAWIWLVDCMPTDAQRIATLKQCLKYLPNSRNAEKAMAAIFARQKESLQEDAEEVVEQPQEDEMGVTPPFAVEAEEYLPGERYLIQTEPEIVQLNLEEEKVSAVEDEETSQSQLTTIVDQVAREKAKTSSVDDIVNSLRDDSVKTTRRAKPLVEDMPAVVMTEAPAKESRSRILFLAILTVLILVAILATSLLSPRSPLRSLIFPATATQTSEPGATESGEGLEASQEEAAGPVETLEPVVTEEETNGTEEVEEPAGTPLPPGIYLSGSPVDSLGWAPDGSLLLVSTTGGASLYDPTNYQTRRYLDSPGPHNLCRFSRAGGRIICGGSAIRVWGAPEGEFILSYDLPSTDGEHVTVLSVLPDGIEVAIVFSSMESSVRFWSAEQGLPLGESIDAPADVKVLESSPDGNLLAGGLANGQILLWNLDRSGEDILIDAYPTAITGLAFSPEGNRLASAARDRKVTLWDVVDGEDVLELEGPTRMTTLDFSPDGEILATGSEDGLVFLWDLATGEVFSTIESFGEGITQVAFSPDGQHLAVGYEGGFVYIYPVER